MTTTTADVKAEPVKISDNEYWRKNKKDDVLLLIKNALKKNHIPLSKMYKVMQSNRYQECKNMGFLDNLTKFYINGLGLRLKLYHNDLSEWKNNQPNNIMKYLDEYEQIIVASVENKNFLNEWKASKYSHYLKRYIDRVVNGE